VVRPGYLEAPIHRVNRVDEPRLLGQLADRLDLRPVFIEAPRHDLVLQWLREGRADIAVSRFSPADLHDAALSPTAEIDWVEDLVVGGHATRALEIEQLSGETLGVHESSTPRLRRWARLARRVELALVPERVPLEEILERVRSGRYGVTITDSMVLEAARRKSGLRLVGTLGGRRPLVWAVRSSNPRLRNAVNHFLFAEKVLARGRAQSSCRDLAEIREVGALRVVTTNTSTTCTVERGGLRGYEYDLVSELARRLGVGVELALPPPRTDPLDWLARGYGDLACLHEPLAPGTEGQLLVTSSYRQVDLVAVVRADEPPLTVVDDLAGLRVAASRQVAAICREMPIDPPMNAVTPFVGATAAAALLDVARGRSDAAVVDSDTAQLELGSQSHLVQGPVVLPDARLVWVTHGGAPRLFSAADGFLRWASRSGLARQLSHNYFSSWEPPRPADLPEVPEGALTPYD
jgi:membrane-bound lytic murein transglycosylase MltF